MAQKVIVTRSEGVAVLTMDAEGRPTCIDIGMCEALLEAISGMSLQNADRAVLVRSTGPVFSAGGDLFAIERFLEDPDRLLTPLIDRFHEVVLAVRRLPMPVVASVHGAAAGAGLSFAMACDLVVAARSGRLVVGYPRIGTSSDGGLTFQLARRLGAAQAMRMFLVDDVIGAERAYELGLIHRVFDDSALEQGAWELAHQLATRPATATKEIKSLISAAADEGLAEHLGRERGAFLRCAKTPEFQQLVGDFTRRQSRQQLA